MEKKTPKNQDPYKTLISEIMLQQTRVNTVLDYYKDFLKKFPDIKSFSISKRTRYFNSMGWVRIL